MKSIAIAITVAVLALIIVHEGRSVSAQIIPPEYRELAEKITIIRDMEGELYRITEDEYHRIRKELFDQFLAVINKPDHTDYEAATLRNMSHSMDSADFDDLRSYSEAFIASAIASKKRMAESGRDYKKEIDFINGTIESTEYLESEALAELKGYKRQLQAAITEAEKRMDEIRSPYQCRIEALHEMIGFYRSPSTPPEALQPLSEAIRNEGSEGIDRFIRDECPRYYK